MITWYIIGCILAFLLGLIQAKESKEKGENIDDLGAGLVFIIFLSWIYVLYVIAKYYDWI